MEYFEFDSLVIQQSINSKIKKFKLISVIILITSIVLLLINIALVTLMYKNNEIIYEELNKINIKIGKNGEDQDKIFLETVNKKFNETNSEINKRIQAIETNLAQGNITNENGQRELNHTIDQITENMENKEQIILESVNKTLNTNYNEMIQRIQALQSVTNTTDNTTIDIVQNSIDKMEKTVENQMRNILENVNKTLDTNINDILKRIQSITSDVTKQNIIIDVIYQELNKSNDNIENFEDLLELQLNNTKVYRLEQNSSCLDTLSRTHNEGIGRSKYFYILDSN